MQRLWYPDFLIDEWLPTGRNSPDAWLAPLDPESDDADDKGFFLGRRADYDPGDKVGFKWCEAYGHVTISINPDGSLHGSQRCPFTIDLFGYAGMLLPADDRQPPNHFYDDESEIWAASADSFARQYADALDVFDGDEPVTVQVDAAYWSEAQYFIISPDGKSLIPATFPETTDHVHG
ncbi:hypothetical protein ASC97_04095 [Rhizobium sp. Root1203]|uniref:hypothetical protein n=1 Tax=Rhizobium sp. Root1203 TaxID=1736427 RepID=UPI00070AACD4|nr:hypothetical protein [Rhizobium sp. Root1203]KQV27568.1 hypothetical protein ASC97_04095 [Rhizobium sp. Root1203]